MKLRSVSGVAVPLVGVQSSRVLRGWVVVMRRSVLLNVVWMLGVRATQHQPPAQGGEAWNWGIRDRGALHAAGCRLRR